MKDSEIEWRKISSDDWSVQRIKNGINKIVNGKWGSEAKNNDDDISIVRIADFNRSLRTVNNQTYTVRNIENLEKDFFINAETDLLIEKSGGGEKTPVGQVVSYRSNEQAGFSNFISKITVRKEVFEVEYLNYLFSVLYDNGIVKKHIKQTTGIQNLDLNSYLNELVTIPRLEIQKKIIGILNQKVSRIDKIISKTQQSIEELKKYKLSLIAEVVTKGLDKNVEMKGSSVEWIGEMPKEWNLAKVNRLFAIKKNIANQSGYNVLSVTQNGLKVKDITRNEGQMAADYSKYQIVKPKDFVMNHMDLLTGWIDTAVQEGVTSPDYRVFYAKDNEIVSNEYYLFVFQICYTNRIFYGLGQGVSNLGRWRLQTDKFLNFYLPLPPINEQQQIVKHLNSKLLKINSLMKQKENLLTELEQYKKSLIYEYVTGKKEV